MATDLPTITLGGITVYDARQWFPYKGTGRNSGAVVFVPRPPASVEEVAIHHDAVAFSGADLNFDGSTVDEERARMQASYDWHTKFWPLASYTPGQGWNWPAMGYHLYTFPSGRIYLVGALGTVRAHVAYRNTRSVGIVGAGDFTNRPPQGLHVVAYGRAAAFVWLWRGAQLQLPTEGHRVWAGRPPASGRSSTTCPGNTHESWIPDVRTVAEAVYNNNSTSSKEDDMELLGVGHDERYRPGHTKFESFRLWATPSGLVRTKIPAAEERFELGRRGWPLLPLPREELELYALR